MWGSNSRYRDLRTIFPPSLKRTPAQVAADHVEESEIALQAHEEGDRVLRVQALREKYESTVYLQQSFHHMQSNKRLTRWCPDPEVFTLRLVASLICGLTGSPRLCGDVAPLRLLSPIGWKRKTKAMSAHMVYTVSQIV
jgi:hypothetical protein